MYKIAVIGAGKWGLALKYALSQNANVCVTSRNKKDVDDFVTLQEALKCEYLVITIPAQNISQWLSEHFSFNNQKILVAAKGIEASSGKFLNEIYEEHVPKSHTSFLSGPSFAAEVIQSLPTALVINSTSQSLAKEFAALFPKFIKTYTSDDVIGAEVAGAYKNVIAIASGICNGLNLGQNAQAALISRGLIEMNRFGIAHGAKEETFMGLSGAGDLFLSASSTMSRNFRVGLGLAKNRALDEIIEELGEVAEGVGTAYALHVLSRKESIYLPIATEVYNILEGKDPKSSLWDLLGK